MPGLLAAPALCAFYLPKLFEAGPMGYLAIAAITVVAASLPALLIAKIPCRCRSPHCPGHVFPKGTITVFYQCSKCGGRQRPHPLLSRE